MYLDHVAFAAAVARNVDPAAVDLHMAVAHELPRGEDCGHEFCAINDGVEAALQKADQFLGGVAAEPRRLAIDRLELLLGDVAVIALQLLLGAQLHAEIRQLGAAPLAVLAGAVFALVDRALGAAPDVLAHPPVDLVLGVLALAHRSSLPFRVRNAPSSAAAWTAADRGWARRPPFSACIGNPTGAAARATR